MGPEVGSLLSEARLRADGRCEVVIYDLEGVWSLSCMDEGGCTYHPDWGHCSLPGNRVTQALRGPRGERRRQAGRARHAGRCCLSCPTGATSTQTVALALDLSGIYLESPCEALDARAQPGLALGVKRAEPAAPSFLPPRVL